MPFCLRSIFRVSIRFYFLFSVQNSGYNKNSTMGYKNAEVQSALSGKAVILKGKWGRNGITTLGELDWEEGQQ